METGLVYYNYRYYSPELGRWLSRDPIEEQGGWNLYGMVNNDIANYWDNFGWGAWKDIPGTNVSARGPEQHTPKGRVHGHVKGYNRQFFPDGTQIPHGQGGKDKDIPKKILEKVMETIFRNLPFFIPPMYIPPQDPRLKPPCPCPRCGGFT